MPDPGCERKNHQDHRLILCDLKNNKGDGDFTPPYNLGGNSLSVFHRLLISWTRSFIVLATLHGFFQLVQQPIMELVETCRRIIFGWRWRSALHGTLEALRARSWVTGRIRPGVLSGRHLLRNGAMRRC